MNESHPGVWVFGGRMVTQRFFWAQGTAWGKHGQFRKLQVSQNVRRTGQMWTVVGGQGKAEVMKRYPPALHEVHAWEGRLSLQGKRDLEKGFKQLRDTIIPVV